MVVPTRQQVLNLDKAISRQKTHLIILRQMLVTIIMVSIWSNVALIYKTSLDYVWDFGEAGATTDNSILSVPSPLCLLPKKSRMSSCLILEFKSSSPYFDWNSSYLEFSSELTMSVSNAWTWLCFVDRNSDFAQGAVFIQTITGRIIQGDSRELLHLCSRGH